VTVQLRLTEQLWVATRLRVTARGLALVCLALGALSLASATGPAWGQETPPAQTESSAPAQGADSAQPLPTPPANAVDLARERDLILEQVQRRDLSDAEVREWIDFAEAIKQHAKRDLTVWERLQRAIRDPWVFFGFAAQGVFMFRFVVQLIASERKKRSHVPIAFWYLSITGGMMLFVYALVRRDPVFVLGQGLGIFIYARNLMLIRNRRNERLDLLEERTNRTAERAETP